MAKEFVRNIKETKLRGKNIEPLYTNEQNDLLSDKQHAYIRNNDFYFPLTQAILDIASANGDGKNPVKPKLNIDGKENSVSLEWDTKALGNNFVEEMPIKIIVDGEYNQIKIGIDNDGLYRFIKPYFTSTKDITVDFDDEQKTISYRLDDQAFFERLAGHFKDGNGLDFVIDNEFKTVHYNLKNDKIKSIIFETVEAKDDDLAVEQQDGKLLIDLSEKNTQLLKNHTSDIQFLKNNDITINDNIDTLLQFTNDINIAIQTLSNKYDEKDVSKITPEQYITDFNEKYPDDNLPLFFELNVLENFQIGLKNKGKISKEKLIYIVDTNNNDTYVVKDNDNNINRLKKSFIDKNARKLVNQKIKDDGDEKFISQFNHDDLLGIIHDLYTINGLETLRG